MGGAISTKAAFFRNPVPKFLLFPQCFGKIHIISMILWWIIHYFHNSLAKLPLFLRSFDKINFFLQFLVKICVFSTIVFQNLHFPHRHNQHFEQGGGGATTILWQKHLFQTLIIIILKQTITKSMQNFSNDIVIESSYWFLFLFVLSCNSADTLNFEWYFQDLSET